MTSLCTVNVQRKEETSMEKYETPQINVIEFETEDVITTSGGEISDILADE
jgi:hypothetical protein